MHENEVKNVYEETFDYSTSAVIERFLIYVFHFVFMHENNFNLRKLRLLTHPTCYKYLTMDSDVKLVSLALF